MDGKKLKRKLKWEIYIIFWPFKIHQIYVSLINCVNV